MQRHERKETKFEEEDFFRTFSRAFSDMLWVRANYGRREAPDMGVRVPVSFRPVVRGGK